MCSSDLGVTGLLEISNIPIVPAVVRFGHEHPDVLANHFTLGIAEDLLRAAEAKERARREALPKCETCGSPIDIDRGYGAAFREHFARNAELAEMVRREQDVKRQISGLYQTINNALSLPPEQRNPKAIEAMQAEVKKLTGQHDSDWRNIERKFPQYANLIDPKPPGVEDIRKALKPGEAFLSFYLGSQNSFVWAVPKNGEISFTAAPIGAAELEKRVAKLREADRKSTRLNSSH